MCGSCEEAAKRAAGMSILVLCTMCIYAVLVENVSRVCRAAKLVDKILCGGTMILRLDFDR